MLREEFQDKLTDLIEEYINTGEDLDLSEEVSIDANFENDKFEAAGELKFEILREK